MIAAMKEAPREKLAWFLLQLAFVLLLLNHHRELGVALPIHLAPVFNVPNLQTALSTSHPGLSSIYATLFPIAGALFIVSLLIAVWYSLKALVGRLAPAVPSQKLRWWIFLPLQH